MHQKTVDDLSLSYLKMNNSSVNVQELVNDGSNIVKHSQFKLRTLMQRSSMHEFNTTVSLKSSIQNFNTHNLTQKEHGINTRAAQSVTQMTQQV
jgi:hypothetical protein